VIQEGRIFIARERIGQGGHIDIARGNNVDFAGTISLWPSFGKQRTNKKLD
jgi:hypothetical protein